LKFTANVVNGQIDENSGTNRGASDCVNTVWWFFCATFNKKYQKKVGKTNRTQSVNH
jgi:hypothetical protein